MMRGLLTIFFFSLVTTAFTQGSASDSVRTDSVASRFIPTGIRVGTDLISIVKSRRQDNFKGWEVNADVDFHRYLLVADYGKWARSYSGDSADYENNGRYWRAGVDVNFLKQDPDRNVFFIGMRYGHASYSESMSLIVKDELWGVLNRSYSNNDFNARWFELTAGLKVRVWKVLWLGYTARMKFGLKHDSGSEMLTYDVPGYGRTDKDTYWGFNYQVMIRIPLRNLQGKSL